MLAATWRTVMWQNKRDSDGGGGWVQYIEVAQRSQKNC